VSDYNRIASMIEERSILDAGLSTSSRLHDLVVDLEEASPSEIKSGGEERGINGGFTKTPFGQALVAMSPRGICWISFFEDESGEASEWSKLQSDWPKASMVRDDSLALDLIRRIFCVQQPTSVVEPLKAFVKGSAFQLKVWRALLTIPFGELRSYGDVACQIGAPSSARAVGNAVGKNPLAFLIPCHRVITADGKIGNYRWGSVRKQAIIAWEHSLHGKQ